MNCRITFYTRHEQESILRWKMYVFGVEGGKRFRKIRRDDVSSIRIRFEYRK